jgi:MoaA/NifB/PqqE/SkfB family radical SAM enzyme
MVRIMRWYQSPKAMAFLEPIFRYYSVHVRQWGYDFRSALSPAPKPVEHPGLVSLNIIPTTFCNADCTYCAHKHLKEQMIMPLSTAKKAIEEYAALGGTSVILTPMVGEALLDPTIFQKIQYANSKHLKVSLFTNAIALNNMSILLRLLKSEVNELQFDIGDVNPKYYAESFGISENIAKKTLRAIYLAFVGYNYEKDRKSIPNLTLAFRSVRSFKKLWKDFKHSEFMEFYNQGLFRIEYLFAYDNWAGTIKQSDLKGVQRLRQCAKVRKFPCWTLLQLSILPNGDARLCGCRFKNVLNDELIIGNINTQSLKEILNSPKWPEIINNFKNNPPEVCKECGFYTPRFIK